MPKTAVGLFNHAAVLDDVVRQIEALGFPHSEVRTLKEPKWFDSPGLMSFPSLDFEVDVGRELARLGATPAEAELYVENLRQGGALVLATGRGAEVDLAAALMWRFGAADVEESFGPEPELPFLVHQHAARAQETSVMTGRLRTPGEEPCFFVW